MEQIVEINTDRIRSLQVDNDLFQNRTSIAEMQEMEAGSEVTIIIQGYNRFEKTKRCVESVLEYTSGIDFELILIDHGSEDMTLEYFQSVAYGKKKIIHITKNLGASYPPSVLNLKDLGRFVCYLMNDLIVTPHWLENLLTCMRSDARIGMVNPVSSNTSNLQEIDLPYTDYDDMRKKAASFNHSDPRKWEDRQRLITLGTLFRKEALIAVGWPYIDAGFFHDFADDDITFRIRRMGYRAVLAGDTWICHDHDMQSRAGEDLAEFQKSLSIGRANFQEKYFGVDAWDDVNNYYIPYLPSLPKTNVKGAAKVLGVDVLCGTPILDVKNWLRRSNVFDTELSAFTQDPKYWIDLKTICTGAVVCDREEFLSDPFFPGYFDYIVVDRPLNRYHEPQKVIDDCFSLCKKGGIMLFKLKNAFSFHSYLYHLGKWDHYDQRFSYDLPIEAVEAALRRKGTVKNIVMIPIGLGEDQRRALNALLPAELPAGQRAEAVKRMDTQEYLLVVEK